MVVFETTTAGRLSAADAEIWSRTLAADSPAPSPYMTPEYFLAVARARPSARVLIGREGAAPVLFFPYHCGGIAGAAGLGHAIGGPVSDVQGVVARRGLGIAPKILMQAAGLSLLPLAHAPATDPVFGGITAKAHAFHVMDFSDGFVAYEAARAAYAKSAFRTIRTRLAKAEAQFGAVTHRFVDTDAASMHALMTWKRAQFAATGQVNVLEVAWVKALVDDLSKRKDGLRAQLSSLWFGDRIVAAHLGLRSETTLHYWFPAYDAEVQDLSPGNLLLYRMAQMAAAAGVRQIHLGSGDYRYKQEFANCSVPMRALTVMAPSWPGRAAETGARMMSALERLLPPKLAPLPAGALRRLDRALAFREL